MPMRVLCDNKRAYKHTGRRLVHCHDPQSRRHAAPCSQLHRQCVAKPPHYRCPRSNGERRPYSARCLRTPRGGKAPHTACSVPALQISQKWGP